MSLRTEVTETSYRIARITNDLRPLADEVSIQDFRYWRIVENRFPHDKIADIHHLLVCKRKSPLESLRSCEKSELWDIYQLIQGDYDSIMINFPSMISVPEYVHFHLYQWHHENR